MASAIAAAPPPVRVRPDPDHRYRHSAARPALAPLGPWRLCGGGWALPRVSYSFLDIAEDTEKVTEQTRGAGRRRQAALMTADRPPSAPGWVMPQTRSRPPYVATALEDDRGRAALTHYNPIFGRSLSAEAQAWQRSRAPAAKSTAAISPGRTCHAVSVKSPR